MLTLAKHSISLYVGSSGRCSTAWGQNEIFCQSKVLFPLVHACYKNLQHRSKQNPIIWAWRNRAKLNFLSDIHWLTFQNNAIFPARSTILLQMAIPCTALYYRHITLFQRDCCIYERVPFCTTTYCKSHHTQPDSFTRTAVCLEGYFSKRCYILLKGLYGRNYICSLKYMEDRTHLF